MKFCHLAALNFLQLKQPHTCFFVIACTRHESSPTLLSVFLGLISRGRHAWGVLKQEWAGFLRLPIFALVSTHSCRLEEFAGESEASVPPRKIQTMCGMLCRASQGSIQAGLSFLVHYPKRAIY